VTCSDSLMVMFCSLRRIREAQKGRYIHVAPQLRIHHPLPNGTMFDSLAEAAYSVTVGQAPDRSGSVSSIRGGMPMLAVNAKPIF
jgi:hypothetical protein